MGRYILWITSILSLAAVYVHDKYIKVFLNKCPFYPNLLNILLLEFQ